MRLNGVDAYCLINPVFDELYTVELLLLYFLIKKGI